MRGNQPGSVPILTYHQVGRFAPAEVRRQRGNYVDAARFAAQVQLLCRLGFQAVTLAQVGRWLSGEAVLPLRPVVFTFDDAYSAVYQHAYPVLSRCGWPATTFVVSSELGGINRWDLPKGISPTPLLDVSELRELMHAGWEIGAHSRTHPRLPGLDPERRQAEIEGSRADLEAALESRITSWCYPYGACDEGVVEAVRVAGFQAAATLQPGTVRTRCAPLRLPRIHVGYRHGLARFLWRLVTAHRR